MKLAGSDDTTATFALPSTELKLLADGMAEITFPSLTAFRNVKSLKLMLPGQQPVPVMWHPLEAPAAKTAAKVNLGTTSIVQQSGKGEINLGFEAPLESKYYLHIIDATVTGTIDTTLAEVVSGKSGVYKLLAQKGTLQCFEPHHMLA